jgi:hypothetical protein
LELSRLEDAIRKGVVYEAFANSMNKLLQRIKLLERRLTEMERELRKELKLPEITDSMVDDIFGMVQPCLIRQTRRNLRRLWPISSRV